MLTKRLIPCLDVKDGRVVKGENFVDLKDQGDPVKMARDYNLSGADELVFLDITATKENRETIKNLAVKVSETLFIPFTVGGGIKSIADFKDLIQAGADKVAINSAAVREPDLITRAAREFGSQAVVVAIDARKKASGSGWEVLISGGSKETDLDLIDWAQKVEELGAGEILLTSIDADGTKAGYDLEQLKAVSNVIGIPLIASGGAGSPEDLYDALTEGEADAALAASIWHQEIYPIKECKKYLLARGLSIRPVGEGD
ncbi:MAG: imidazole glycerol phosphate synthase subunit HisF [Halanaerobiaceae bacterium]